MLHSSESILDEVFLIVSQIADWYEVLRHVFLGLVQDQFPALSSQAVSRVPLIQVQDFSDLNTIVLGLTHKELVENDVRVFLERFDTPL